MPIVLRRDFSCGWLALWHITESTEQLNGLVDAASAAQACSFGSEKRRREWLAWRALLKDLRPDLSPEYDHVGAPIIDHGYVSVSHAGDYACVVFSVERCAVDIERMDRKYSNITSRYISQAEAQLPASADPLFPAVMWCSKETLYKLAGRNELDLLEDIQITECNIASNTVLGNWGGVDVEMSFFTFDNLVVVHTFRFKIS